MVAQFLAFLGVAALVIVTPGPDTALTVRNALLGGRAGGAFTALGVVTGLAVWTVAASAGIAALLVASEPAFVALKLVGALYLIGLGVHSLRAALRHDPAVADRADSAGPRLAARAAFRQGLLNDLGNPKIAVFFTSLLPQFAPGGDASFFMLLAMGLAFCLMTFAWLVAYTLAIARARSVLRRPAVRRALDALTGFVLIALGLRIAAERR